MKKLLLVAFAITILCAASVAQTSQSPCSDERVKEFDFWVGQWDLEWKTASGDVQKGTNSITRILDGCVVREEFDGGSALPLKGQSYSMLDRNSGQWKQTWVDNQGSYLDFSGGMEEGKMVLRRQFTNRQGNEVSQRMVFYNIAKDGFDWNWESSTDGGSNWKVLWQIKYSRRK